MSINLSDVTATGGLSMSPEIFSGSIQSTTTAQYLQVNPASTLFNLVGDFTFEAWVYPTSLTGWGIFDARTSGASASPWLVQLADLGSGYVIMFFDGSYYYGTNIVPLNTWSHVAVVRSGSTLTYYLNGAVDTTISYTSANISPGSTNPVVGATKDNFPFPGNISNLRLVVGVAVYTSAFTPSSSPLTVVQPANFNGNPSSEIVGNQTVLLLNTPNNGFNARDSSNNNFTLLNTGMPIASVNTPFFPATSINFNGTSDYLLVPSMPVIGTSQFTIECWVNVSSSGGPYGGVFNPIISFSSGGGGFRVFVGIDGSWSVWDSSSTILSGSSSGFSVGEWTHFAVQRDGSDTLTVYINGVSVGTTTATNNWNGITGSGAYIAADDYDPSYRLWGNISNFRYVLGLAVYTSNFTPSIYPLTDTQSADINGNPSSAITGTETQLLLNTFYTIHNYVDSSSYNRVVTPVGSPQTAGSAIGSSYFDNTSFNIPASSYGTLFDQDGAFTIECWFNPTANSPNGAQTIWYAQENYFWNCFYNDSGDANNGKFYIVLHGPNTIVLGTNVYTTKNTWYHIALSSDGTNTRLFVNGVLEATTSGTGAATSSGNTFQIGYYINGPYSEPVIGNISNFRMVKGVGVYTSAFTPSTTPLTVTQAANVNGNPSSAISVGETVLLLSTPNNLLNYYDSSIYNLITTYPLTPLPSAWNPFNLGSISFHDGYYLQTSESTLFNFDVNDFTLETFAYWSSAKTGNETIFEGTGGTRLIFGISSTGVRLYTDTGENGCSYSFSVDTWYHIAIVRLGGNISIYVNGTLANTPFADSTVWAFTTETIGCNSDTAEAYTGEISNLRVVNGVAVYTGAFTVPSQPLTVSQIAGTNINSTVPEQTVLLLNTPDSLNNLLDNSAYHLTLTSMIGTPTAIVNNPFGPL